MSSPLHAPHTHLGQRLQEVLRHEGSAGLIARVARRLKKGIVQFERVAFYDSDLTQSLVDLPPLADAVEFVAATPYDLLTRYRACLEADFGLGRLELSRRSACSHVALLGLHEGVVVAMLWLAFNEQSVSEIGRTMVLHEGEVLTYNEFTSPEWRGRGISPRLNQFAQEFALKRHATRRINWRSIGNTPAIRVANKLEDRLFATVATVRVFGVRHAFVFGAQAPQLAPLLRAS